MHIGLEIDFQVSPAKPGVISKAGRVPPPPLQNGGTLRFEAHCPVTLSFGTIELTKGWPCGRDQVVLVAT